MESCPACGADLHKMRPEDIPCPCGCAMTMFCMNINCGWDNGRNNH